MEDQNVGGISLDAMGSLPTKASSYGHLTDGRESRRITSTSFLAEL
jgi:hypothetical protein